MTSMYKGNGGLCGGLVLGGAFLAARYLFQHGVRMPVAGEPFFRRRTIVSDMNELRALAGAIEDPHRTDRWPLDDRETQGAGSNIEGAIDAEYDGAVAAMVTFMDGEAVRRGVAATGLAGLLADQAAGAVSGPPGSEFFLMALRRLGRSIRPGHDGSDRNERENERRGHEISPEDLRICKRNRRW